VRVSHINTPKDWMNLPDWDRYWSEVLADEFWKSANFIEMLNIRERESFEGPFRAAGFREVDGWLERDRGERDVLFWHGSG
jgi:hypothetical protein